MSAGCSSSIRNWLNVIPNSSENVEMR